MKERTSPATAGSGPWRVVTADGGSKVTGTWPSSGGRKPGSGRFQPDVRACSASPSRSQTGSGAAGPVRRAPARTAPVAGTRSAAEGAARRRRSVSCRAAAATAASSSRRCRRPGGTGTRTDTADTAVKARNIHMPVRSARPAPMTRRQDRGQHQGGPVACGRGVADNKGSATLGTRSAATGCRRPAATAEDEGHRGVAATDRGRRGHRGPCAPSGRRRWSRSRCRGPRCDVRVRYVQPRVFAGELGIRDHDLGSAAADPEPAPPQRTTSARAGTAVHGEHQRGSCRVPGPGAGPAVRTAPSDQHGAVDQGSLADRHGGDRRPRTDRSPVP